MPRKTIAQIKAEIKFGESIPSPCCANCKHWPGVWVGCKHPQHEFALRKEPRSTVCADHHFDRHKH
jgi:hypothetical protein